MLTFQGKLVTYHLLSWPRTVNILQGWLISSSRPHYSSVSFKREEKKEVIDVSQPWGSYLTGILAVLVSVSDVYYGILGFAFTPLVTFWHAERRHQWGEAESILTVSSTMQVKDTSNRCPISNVDSTMLGRVSTLVKVKFVPYDERGIFTDLCGMWSQSIVHGR